MHEYSVVQAIIATCKQVAAKNKTDTILKIHVTAGRMSGVDPHFLEQSYQVFREETICEHAELIITIEEVEAKCRSCWITYPVKKFCFECPNCGRSNTDMIKGKSLHITHIEVSAPPSPR